MTHNVDACPDCDSAQVRTRATVEKSRRYLCQDCGAEFPEPNQREAKRDIGDGTHSGIGKKLLEMDPDDWP